jgi:deferrochelatase/peroxidase EfeB
VGRTRGAAGAASPYAFYGAHQAGITTPVQDHLHFASFDMMAGTTREDLIELLQDWSYAASRMTQGLDVSASGAVGGSPEAPPDDTGEALGLAANGLTITFGFGPTCSRPPTAPTATDSPIAARPAHRAAGVSRRRPGPDHTGGDLCIQACADDPQVAVHAIRNLSRIAFGRARLRWSQLGFGKTSKTTADQATPATSSGSRTARPTSSPTTRRRWISTSGSATATNRPGSSAAPISWRARSRCSSRRGIACV